MDSTPKRHKSPIAEETLGVVDDDDGGDGDKQEEDRISNLPDSILSHLISKLPTKHAVATAVLSTKWKHLFPQIPNLVLSINDSLLLHPHLHDAASAAAAAATDTNTVSHRRNTNFINFMYNLLTVTLRDVPSIRRLYLKCNQDYGNAHIDAWISAVLRLNVTDLSLFFHVKNTGVSIPSLFHSTTLVHLFLTQHRVVNVPSSVCLPNLKLLFLDSVRFDSVSLERVLDGCPVLEDLSLASCEFEDIDVLSISSDSLKHLMIYSCHEKGLYEVDINTPRVEFLHYDDHVAQFYHGMNLDSLLTAHIDVGPSDVQVEIADDDDDLAQYDQNVAKLVAACYNVEFLYISMPSVTCIHRSSCPMPTFHNLTKLVLGNLNNHGWELLPHLLESAPKLETLLFKEGMLEHKECFTKFQSSLLNNVPACLSLSLQIIYFEEFNGEQDELELVRCFLETAEVLKKMRFTFPSSLPLEKQFCTWVKLILLQTCSKNCKIQFEKEVDTNIGNFSRMEGSQKIKIRLDEIATSFR